MRILKVIDLFSGAGGLTTGFCWLSCYPFETVWANDFNTYAVETYNRNFDSHCVLGDIVDILSDPVVNLPKADVVVGGPPCQGFSLLNKKRADDPRKKLWIPFMNIVETSGAEAFLMENVPQLLGSFEYEEIVDAAAGLGFSVWSGMLSATDFGVPQSRKRAFIVGAKHFNPNLYFPPLKTHYPPDQKPNRLEIDLAVYTRDCVPWLTVRDAISDLPQPVGTEIRDAPPPLNIHFGRNPTPKSIARYRTIPEEGMNRFDLERLAPELTPDCWKRKKKGGTDLFGRLWWDKPSVTIRTEFFKPEKGRYLHPVEHRPITHREAARLQTFPDYFVFSGSKIEIARQIGNAVPPIFAARMADRLYEMITQEVNSSCAGSIPGMEKTGDHVSRPEQEHARRVGSKVITS